MKFIFTLFIVFNSFFSFSQVTYAPYVEPDPALVKEKIEKQAYFNKLISDVGRKEADCERQCGSYASDGSNPKDPCTVPGATPRCICDCRAKYKPTRDNITMQEKIWKDDLFRRENEYKSRKTKESESKVIKTQSENLLNNSSEFSSNSKSVDNFPSTQKKSSDDVLNKYIDDQRQRTERLNVESANANAAMTDAINSAQTSDKKTSGVILDGFLAASQQYSGTESAVMAGTGLFIAGIAALSERKAEKKAAAEQKARLEKEQQEEQNRLDEIERARREEEWKKEKEERARRERLEEIERAKQAELLAIEKAKRDEIERKISIKKEYFNSFEKKYFNPEFSQKKRKAILIFYPKYITENIQEFMLSSPIDVQSYDDGSFPLQDKALSMILKSNNELNLLNENESYNVKFFYPINVDNEFGEIIARILQDCGYLELSLKLISAPSDLNVKSSRNNSLDFWEKTNTDSKVPTKNSKDSKKDFWENTKPKQDLKKVISDSVRIKSNFWKN